MDLPGLLEYCLRERASLRRPEGGLELALYSKGLELKMLLDQHEALSWQADLQVQLGTAQLPSSFEGSALNATAR